MRWNPLPWFAPGLAFALASCAGKLVVGTGTNDELVTDGGLVIADGPGLPQKDEAGALTCSPGDCAGYTFSCSEGTPTDVACVLDRSPEFIFPICALEGRCAAGATPQCAWSAAACSGAGPCSAIGGGGGYVEVDVGTGGSTTTRAYFNHGLSSASQTFGACTLDPYAGDLTQSGVVGSPAPRPGVIEVSSTGFHASLSPACDGSYAPLTTSGGPSPDDLVSFAWSAASAAGSGDGFPGALPSVPAPHAATLGSGDLLAASSPEIPRAADLALSWSFSGTPQALEHLVVQVTQGTAVLTCAYDASAGSGVIPSDALLALDAGAASYAVVSSHEADIGNAEGGWDLAFRVEADATGTAGAARGTLTLR